LKYLFDSNTVNDLYEEDNENYPKLWGKITSLKKTDEVYISIFTQCELEYGLENAFNDCKEMIRDKITNIESDFIILPAQGDIAKYYGKIKKALKEKRGIGRENLKKHNIDLLIASTAISEECILVSSDGIFQDIPQLLKNNKKTLKYENWLK
jgi:predicted nucleic acid-binding protein